MNPAGVRDPGPGSGIRDPGSGVRVRPPAWVRTDSETELRLSRVRSLAAAPDSRIHGFGDSRIQGIQGFEIRDSRLGILDPHRQRHREYPVSLPQRDDAAGVFLFRKLAGNEAIAQATDFVFVKVPCGIAELLRRGIRSRHEAVARQRLQDVLMVSIHAPNPLFTLH